ncbi:MAG: protoporphyrinogen oxidase [Proteobacteria bacterium]|nr:protoporphyrinogen oxidase [Pseudomonadota bacterium]MBU1059738.1 protoporphyrinogen oxidase [Pseudomonadota bacterium]
MKDIKDTLIIGAGLSGLTVAWKLRQLPEHSFLLLEQSEKTGGAIWSHSENGYLAEGGPHGFLDNCPESRALLEESGLEQECVRAPLARFVRYVCMNGSLKLIPQTPAKILAAPLISPLEKLRVVADLWKKPLAGEPTVSEWVRYRFGKALLPYVDAVFTGTYAGDLERLVIDGVMPGVRQIEKEHGSVIRGLLKKMKGARNTKKGTKKSLPAMTSFPQGMTRLGERLSQDLIPGKELLTSCSVNALSRTNGCWQVETGQGNFRAHNLVLALPVNRALALLAGLGTPPPQTKIAEAKIVTIALGFGAGASLPPGFGYLTPEQEQRFCLGALFSSNMFPQRAPAGHILLEALVGGRRHPERLQIDDANLIKEAVRDLRQLLNLPGEPTYSRVLRPGGGIPQLEGGYPALLQWRNTLMQKEKGLYVTGFGWEGIGLNDMIKTAFRVSEAIKEGEQDSGEQEAAIKKVYF